MTASGYGFVETAEGSFFVPASKTGGAFDGDMVEVAPMTSGRGKGGRRGEGSSGRPAEKPAARVVRVLHRAHETVVGRYEVADPFGVVVPQDRRIPYDIFTMRSDNPDVPDGAMVRVRMVGYPTRREAATGVVEEVLGDADDAAVDIEVVIAQHQLETKFSQGSLDEAQGAAVDVAGALADGYRDLRGRFVFTIDPEDARDFDDAVSLEQAGPGRWRLGVHIADVSHYVPWGSSIDLDARRRATSVYLVDRVIPMLPERLSGDICSLLPGRPRRAMTADMLLDGRGRVLRSEFYPSVIESKARLSYERAQCFLDVAAGGGTWQDAAARAGRLPEPAGALELCDAANDTLFRILPAMGRIAGQRIALRREAGGIDFDTVEAKVQLDGEGEPVAVKLRAKTAATSLVEEAMLMANECAARLLDRSGTPGIFRVHDAPSPDSLAALLPVLQEFGYTADVSAADIVSGDPRALQAVLARAQGRPEEPLVTQIVLRSMQRAVYSESCRPHFALASPAYCHFTSPIRRYPDLVVHRMIKAHLRGKPGTFAQQADCLGWLAEHSSAMERVADAAARETQELKLVEYMRRYIGSTLPGLVVGVAPYGVYVQLENTAEGLVSSRDLGAECFSFDPALHILRGQDSGREYRLGQRLRVVVADAPEHERRLVLRLPAGGE